jgi:hypothetical protein
VITFMASSLGERIEDISLGKNDKIIYDSEGASDISDLNIVACTW